MVCRVRCWLVRLILVCFPLAASTYGHGQATLPDAGGGKHILTRVSIWPMHSIYASSSICVIRSYDVFGHAQLRTAFLFPPQTDPIMVSALKPSCCLFKTYFDEASYM